MKKIFLMTAMCMGMSLAASAANDVTGIKLLGDANDDGTVDIADVAAVLTIVSSGSTEGYHAKNADANKDGAYDIADVAAILTIMAGGE